MTRSFQIVEATYPKKYLTGTIFLLILIIVAVISSQVHFLNNLDPGVFALIVLLITILFLYIQFTVKSFKKKEEIIFKEDYISVKSEKGRKKSFSISDLKKPRFVYQGIFGDTETFSLSIANQINTKDGSGNFFTFEYHQQKFYFNMVLDDINDVKALKIIFESMKKNHNVNMIIVNKA